MKNGHRSEKDVFNPLPSVSFATYTAPAGEMAEWSKAHDSKSCRPPKGLEGSNPSLSARENIDEPDQQYEYP